ncbi:MAG: hypothetical protein WBO04_03305 [Steroidobacteraceae bacterium]
MSALVEAALWRVAREIEPTPTQKARAQGSHNYLRNLLNTGQMAQRITNSYLSGSYARDTAIRPIDDVDIVFEIDSTAWGSGFTLLAPLPAPERVLESFANAIRYRYPVSSVFGQRRSVRLSLYHLDIDVVPAVPDRQQRWLVSIPDRDSGEWIRSAPRKHQAVAAEVNALRQGRFKPLVKLLKYWNSNLPETIRAKSFMVETLATHLFRSVPFDSLESGLIYFWDFVATRFGSPGRYAWRDQYGMSFGLLGVSVPDAAGTGSNTASGFTVSQFSSFSGKARISRDRLIAAQNARSSATLQAHIDSAFRA